MRNVFGLLMVLASCLCAFLAYREAGGMHGYFRVERLARGDAMIASGGAVALLLFGLVLLLGGSKKKQQA